MIRTTAADRSRVSRPVRVGVAAASVVGIAVLAGCSTGTAEAESDASSTSAATPTAAATDATASESAPTDAAASDSQYTDGTYTADGSYQTPESVETITVTVTLADDIVTAVEVTGNPTKSESKQYQSQFIGGIADVVVGKDINDLSVSRVAGSSLTSGGFNDAIEQIKDEAAA